MAAISVDNGVRQVSEGSKVGYRITVENQSSSSHLAASVSAVLPEGFQWASADADGARKGDQVRWKLRVAPQRSEVLTLRGTVGSASGSVDRLALVACAEGGKSPVCATDMDDVAPGGWWAGGYLSWLVVAASGVAALGLAGFLAWFLHRRKAPAEPLTLPAQSSATATGGGTLLGGAQERADAPSGIDASEDEAWSRVSHPAVAEPVGPFPDPNGGAEFTGADK